MTPNSLLLDLAKTLKSQETRQLDQYEPYSKQLQFHRAGATCRERCLLAGNRLGKTYSGGMEVSMHLTGRYPDWWNGRVFDAPIRCWGAGITNQQTRDAAQRILFGAKGQIGTGTLPLDAIQEISYSRVISDFIDTAVIKHVGGGVSHVAFKAYEQAKKTASKASPWGGDEIHVMWFDEEPPVDVYGEGLARIASTGGIAFITATPLLGMTDVVRKFYPEPDETFRHLTMMSIEDAEHIPEARRAEIIAGYAPHEREARIKGVPMLGSGRVFTVPEEMVKEAQVEVPNHWAQLGGIDFGWDHPTACVWGAWDRDNDVLHITHCYKQSEATPIIHAAAMKARGDWIQWAWPHDGMVHDKQSGVSIAEAYRRLGVKMLPEHATFAEGGYGVEAGVMEMMDRMQTGRLRVAQHLEQWFDEYRQFHRKDGKIVKERDDLMAATRYLVMCLRYARPYQRKEFQLQASMDYDPLNPSKHSRVADHARYLSRLN